MSRATEQSVLALTFGEPFCPERHRSGYADRDGAAVAAGGGPTPGRRGGGRTKRVEREAIDHVTGLADGTGVVLCRLRGDVDAVETALERTEGVLDHHVTVADQTVYAYVHFVPTEAAEALLELRRTHESPVGQPPDRRPDEHLVGSPQLQERLGCLRRDEVDVRVDSPVGDGNVVVEDAFRPLEGRHDGVDVPPEPAEHDHVTGLADGRLEVSAVGDDRTLQAAVAEVPDSVGVELVEIGEYDPAARGPEALLTDDGGRAAVEIAGDLGCARLQPSLDCCDERLVERAHTAGLTVDVWTVERRAAAESAVRWGADGVIADRPDVRPDGNV